MRISDLSEVTGMSIPTIKYYLREGLLRPGTPTAPNQARYSEEHVQRLRLIRALTEVGNLTLAAVRDVIGALEDEELPLHDLLGVAQYALGPTWDAEPSEAVATASGEIDGFLADRGWNVAAEAPSRRSLAEALVTLRLLSGEVPVEAFEPYARAVEEIAAYELGTLVGPGSRTETVEGAIVGTVVYEAVIVALRRLAHEHHSSARFGTT